MSFYVVNNEYDMDQAIGECIKLIHLQESRIKLGFNNMGMVNIFMANLGDECDAYNIDPEERDFHIDVLVNAGPDDIEDVLG